MNPDDNDQQNKLCLYDDILRMVEEEIYQRKTPVGYVDHNTTDKVRQSGGNRNNNLSKGMIPGKFEAMRFSMEPPIDVALRGTVARQVLFSKEFNL